MSSTGNVVFLFSDRGRVKSVLKEEPAQADEFGQLSLPFAELQVVYLTVSSQIHNSSEFEKLVHSLRISEMLDMRFAPRLDFLAPSRSQAFHFFESNGIVYRDMFGRVNKQTYDAEESTYSDLWAAVIATLEPLNRKSSAALLVFDSLDFLKLCKRALASVFSIDVVDRNRLDYLMSQEDLLRM